MRNRRVSGRGAALVEAAFVAPIFAMFWLITVHISGVYQYKIRSAQESRYAAFYRATNGCEKSGAGTYQDITSTDSDQPPQSFVRDNGAKGYPGSPTTSGGQAGSSIAGSGARGDDTKNVTSATAYGTWKYDEGSSISTSQASLTVTRQSVYTTSQVVCNEPPSGINFAKYLANVAGEVGSAAKSFISGH